MWQHALSLCIRTTMQCCSYTCNIIACGIYICLCTSTILIWLTITKITAHQNIVIYFKKCMHFHETIFIVHSGYQHLTPLGSWTQKSFLWLSDHVSTPRLLQKFTCWCHGPNVFLMGERNWLAIQPMHEGTTKFFWVFLLKMNNVCICYR
jgi:hypothetical protein